MWIAIWSIYTTLCLASTVMQVRNGHALPAAITGFLTGAALMVLVQAINAG
jgi:hypothetical protein